VKKLLMGICVFLVLGGAALGAQSLLDNEYYKQAVALQAQSDRAFEAGDYDNATIFAKQAKENFEKSDAYVQKMLGFYRANGWLERANERLTYAKAIDADVHYAEDYDRAANDVANSKVMLDAAEYTRSVYLSKDAIEALKDVAPVQAAKPPEPPPEMKETPLPATYTVRLNMQKRDCFWRIAALPFVYNDPWKWKTLYEANKAVIADPKNPDLIEPGQVFTIPSIQGEVRDGEYDPEKTYTPLEKTK
jgi:hypothetical protein